MLGSHVIKSWRTNQAVIVLLFGEAEYYGMVKGASQAMELKAIAEDIGVSYTGPMQINADASAAIGIASRLGLGKVRHIEVTQLWLQEKVYKREIVLKKIGTLENIADAMTKPVNAETLKYHVDNSSAECRRDRHRLAPDVTEDKSQGEEGEAYDDERPEEGRRLDPRAAEEAEGGEEH